jgi:hypothetical protein
LSRATFCQLWFLTVFPHFLFVAFTCSGVFLTCLRTFYVLFVFARSPGWICIKSCMFTLATTVAIAFAAIAITSSSSSSSSSSSNSSSTTIGMFYIFVRVVRWSQLRCF